MYSINTQLAYFKYGLDSERILVNITWFKLALGADLQMQTVPIEDSEMEQFKAYMALNKDNFPGPYFIENIHRSTGNIIAGNSAGSSRFPSYLILSQNKSAETDPALAYKIMHACLTYQSYQEQKVYDLNFDLLGKIQVYKEIQIGY